MAKIQLNDDSFNQLVNECAGNKAELELKKAQLELDITELKKERSLEIDALDKLFKSQKKTLESYAKIHRERLFNKKQTIDNGVAVVGFRFNPQKVVPITKAKDGDMVELLKAKYDSKGMEFLTVSYALDKSKIGEALTKGVKWLTKLFQHTQSETFIVEPNENGTKK